MFITVKDTKFHLHRLIIIFLPAMVYLIHTPNRPIFRLPCVWLLCSDIANIQLNTYFAFLSAAFTGRVLWCLSPIRVPSSFPTRDITSPVASSRLRLSIRRTSAWSTRLEFWKDRKTYIFHTSLTHFTHTHVPGIAYTIPPTNFKTTAQRNRYSLTYSRWWNIQHQFHQMCYNLQFSNHYYISIIKILPSFLKKLTALYSYWSCLAAASAIFRVIELLLSPTSCTKIS